MAALGVNFAIWGIAVIPAYLVVRDIGVRHVGVQAAVERRIEEDGGI